jgi:hypothetical protein
VFSRMSSAPTRRQFLRSAVRWLAAPIMVGALGEMTRRKGETCIINTFCRTCAISETCGLPQALSFRDATSKGKTHAG